MSDSKTALIGVDLSVSLKAVRVSMLVLGIGVIVGWCSTAESVSSAIEGPRVVMA